MTNNDDEDEDARIWASLTPEQRERLERLSKGEAVGTLNLTNLLDAFDEIKTLEEEVAKQFPAATFERDNPVKPDGAWFLDIRLGERFVVVQWFARLKQWGVSDGSDPDPLYTHQADKAFDTSAEALVEVARLLTK